jgi:hypothetical protein
MLVSLGGNVEAGLKRRLAVVCRHIRVSGPRAPLLLTLKIRRWLPYLRRPYLRSRLL